MTGESKVVIPGASVVIPGAAPGSSGDDGTLDPGSEAGMTETKTRDILVDRIGGCYV
ncbi:MAG: hypothetical protein LBN12_05070 [Clostridiales Family XIII bacterium]|nr:hypothetical protein [Clostridiales Family XIII bacterium]